MRRHKKLMALIVAVSMIFSSLLATASEINSFDVSNDGAVTMTVNKTDDTVGGKGIAAVYDKDGNLLGMSISEEISKEETGVKTLEFENTLDVPEGGIVKGFLWKINENGYLTVEPLSEAFTPDGQPTFEPVPTQEATEEPKPTPVITEEPTAEPTEEPTPAPTLAPLEEGVISAFRYLNEVTVSGFNTEGIAQAVLTASEDGSINTPFTMTSGDYTDESGLGRNTPALAPIAAWGEKPYIQVAIATKGYTDISVSAKVGATKKGPANYKLQYSTDGENFTDVATYTLASNKTLYNAFDKVALEGAGECDMLYIRIIPDGTTLINGGELTGASGEYAVNDILIYGTATGGPTAEPIPTPSPTPMPEGDGIIHLLGDSINADGVANVTVSGTTVAITAAGEYTIEGTLNEGQIKVASATSDDEITINLDGVNVTNTTDDVFTSSNGKVTFVPMPDTENSFNATSDGACAIYGKHDITVKGEGKLTANSTLGNGIRSKKDVEIGVCDLVVNAGNNGIKGDKSVKITKKNKSVTIVSNGDGIKSDLEPKLVTDETTGETTVEGGTVTINGGTINITANSETDATTGEVSNGDGIQADTLLEIKGGTINITAMGEAMKANASSIAYLEDETATAGTPAEGDGCVVISGGTITASSGEDAIKAVKNVTVSDGADITVTQSQEGIQVNEIIYTDETETTVLGQVEGSINIDGGTLNITSTEDGIQCGTGDVTITGGTVTINSQFDCIQSEDVMYITGGTFDLTAHGGASGTATEDSCKGIKAKNLVKITDGTYDINTYDDAIHSNHTVRISGGDITAASADDGVHGDYYLYISDSAKINVTKSYEGIEAAEIYISGGETYVVSSDDGANAAGDQPTEDAYDVDTVTVASMELFAGGNWNQGGNWGAEDTATYGYMELSDGLLYIEAEGDGFDSNGSALISGGTLMVNGPTSGGNGVFDIGDGNNYTLTVTGGTIVGAGTSDMAVTPDSSTQYYVLNGNGTSGGGSMRPGQNQGSGNVSIQAGQALQLTDAGGNVVITYVPAKTTSWLLISTPEMQSGTYTLSYGGSVSGGTCTKGTYGIVTDGTYSGGTTKTLTATK